MVDLEMHGIKKEEYVRMIEYVNSKDIREYWNEIGYKPAVLESLRSVKFAEMINQLWRRK